MQDKSYGAEVRQARSLMTRVNSSCPPPGSLADGGGTPKFMLERDKGKQVAKNVNQCDHTRGADPA